MDEKLRPCMFCREGNYRSLVSVSLCRNHLNMIRGISPFENHHPEGRVNSPETVSIPADVHAVLTAKQLDWADPLKAHNDDPLIQIARRIRVTMDYLEYLLNTCQRDSNFLLGLSLTQQELNGPDWWKRGEMAPLANEVINGN